MMITVEEIKKILNINAMEESSVNDLYSEISVAAEIDIEAARSMVHQCLAQMVEDDLVGIYQYSNGNDSTSNFVEVSIE